MASRAVRVVVALVLAVLVLAPPGVAVAATRSAPPSGTPSTVVERGDELNNSLPKPNSGHEPTDAGDPGGAAELGLLGAMVVGTAFIGFMITREVRRSRRRINAATRH